MSFTSFVVDLLVAWFCCIIPAFQTFKALNNRTVNEALLERWCKYWVFIGILFAYQATIETFVSWIPFYYEVKTVLLLFLALPQTEGSTYIYENFLKPYLTQNEAQFDSIIESVQSNTFAFVTAQLQNLWQFVYSNINKGSPANPGAPAGQAPQQPGSAPSLGAVFGALKTYGPGLLGAFQGSQANGSQSSTPVASATASSVSLPTPDQRTPYQAEDKSANPPFPEPTHFTPS
ncbi:TB2/DP1, HVA22 family-domain-containing protein [Flagelloscypha sp. PMI_526]|nr:TB2/DP1, HVA22 family-domain-containing protein [Flagelloscypha sp. PMI_526]